MATDDIKRVMDAHVKELMAVPGVVGVAIGALENGQLCIKVFAAKRTPEMRKQIPKTLEGYRVVVEVTGEFHAMPDSAAD